MNTDNSALPASGSAVIDTRPAKAPFNAMVRSAENFGRILSAYHARFEHGKTWRHKHDQDAHHQKIERIQGLVSLNQIFHNLYSCMLRRYTASAPVSPVRIRTTSSSEATKILPSPTLPVLAALVMASRT